jgi:hypothetical protein
MPALDYATLVTALDPALAHRMGGVEGSVENDVGDGIEAAVRQVLGAADEIAGGVVHQAG